MNFEQNNNMQSESLKSYNQKESSVLSAQQNNNTEISEQELINLKNKEEERINIELAKIRESILNNPDKDQGLEKEFDLEIKAGEADFDFLGRLSKFLVEKQEAQNIKNNPDESHKMIKLLKKKGEQINEAYQDENNQKLIRLSFIEAMKSLDSRELLNSKENERCLNEIDISTSSRNMSWDLNENSEHYDKVGFFSETNQERSFFPSRYKKDGVYYSGSLFNVHSNSAEAREYLKKKLDGKVIYLLGGGKSADDLLQDAQINPKQIVNIDPFISEESVERNQKGLYKSIPERADSQELISEINSNNIELADEIWASYSVPYYNESVEEINNLFGNIKGLLREGGNCRITPVATQNEQANQEMLNNLKSIVDSKKYNIHLYENTLVVHKLENKD